MAVIVANVYQQAAMCVTEKHGAPRWLKIFALNYMSPLLRMEKKVKAVLSQTVSECLFFENNQKFIRSIGCFFSYERKRKIDQA
jgi:hypothetical protein